MSDLLSEVEAIIRDAYGIGSIFRIDGDSIKQCPSTSTGSLGLDIALGIGGYPTGKIIEIYGPESSGKTTLALCAINAALKDERKVCCIIDVEQALNMQYINNLGIKRLLISQPESGEEALEICAKLCKAGSSLVVVDSVAALSTHNEREGDIGDQHIGATARLMSAAMRILVPMANANNCTIIFINQIRNKIGSYGNPETTPGGNALKFAASVRLEVRRTEHIKDHDNIIGNGIKVKIVKSKVSSPYKVVNLDIIYGHGISKVREIIDIAQSEGLIEKSGAWYSYNGQKIGQGKENVTLFLNEHPDILTELEASIRVKYNIIDNQSNRH